MRHRPLAIVWLAALAAPAAAQNAPFDFEAFTRAQPNGLVDVGAMNLPDAFIERIAERSMRMQFRRSFRRVAAGPEPPEPADPPALAPAAPAVRVIAEPLAPEIIARWRTYLDDVPLLRGFRAPRLAHADDAWPIEPPLGRDAERYRRAARFVSEHLARDGLVRTTMGVAGAADLAWTRDGALDATTFRAVGIPVDLLDMFALDGDGSPIAGAIAEWIDAGAPAKAIGDLAARARFRFTPSRAGFRSAAEDGTAPIGGFRLQVSQPRFVRGPGEGSAVDVLRQLATGAIDAPLWVSVHDSKIDALLETMGGWPIVGPQRITVVRAPAGVSDWAQDNGEPGTAGAGPGAVVTLVPRYASRNEQVSKLLVGDSLVFDTLTGVVGEVVVSPLLFQGGNIMRVVDPASGAGILLVGEAEIHRNRGLGLTDPQVAGALAAEFGASRIINVPAISFHVDMEVAVRRRGRELHAFVVDDIAGARHVVTAGLDALVRGGAMDGAAAARLADALRAGGTLAATVEIRRVLAGLTDAEGALSADAAALFGARPFEAAAANAGRFLLAVDVLTASAIRSPPAGRLTPEQRYIVSLRDRLRERQTFAQGLESRGFRVHPIPALGDDELGVNYVNVVHTPTSMLVPVMGGFFAPLDAAALDAYRAVVGDEVALVPIHSAHAQTRFGGVHCLVAAYPD